MPKGSQIKRMAPEGTLSDEIEMKEANAVDVTKNSVALAGLHLYGLLVTKITAGSLAMAAASTLSIIDGGTVLTTVQMGTTANIAFSPSIVFPAPLPITGALTIKGLSGDTYKVRAVYQKY